MKYYTKKPDVLLAFKIDFSTDEKKLETLRNLDRCNHTLIHQVGCYDYAVKLDGTDKEFHQGDYICCNIKECRWFGRDGRHFEEDWDEVDTGKMG